MTAWKTYVFSQTWYLTSDFWSIFVVPGSLLSYLEGRRGRDGRSTISFCNVLAWAFLSPDCFQKERFPSSLSPLKPQPHIPILFLRVIIDNHKPQEYLNHLIGPATFIFTELIPAMPPSLLQHSAELGEHILRKDQADYNSIFRLSDITNIQNWFDKTNI